MKRIPDDTTEVVRQGVERACADFSVRMASLGFAPAKKMYWARRHEHTVDFIHLHLLGSSYGTPYNYSVGFRLHFAIRVLNDPLKTTALNGPLSDYGRIKDGRYHLRFNAKTGSSFDRCAEDLGRFALEAGEPWFLRFREPEALLTQNDSPLKEAEKASLRLAIDGHTDTVTIAQSLKLLGIK